MIRILIPLILLLVIVALTKRYLKQAPPGEERSRYITVLLIGFAFLMVLLALTGRLHWVGAALAALAPVVKILLAASIDYYRRKKLHEYVNNTAGKSDPSGKLSEEEAIKILGLEKPYTEEQIIHSHRRLMAKVHPDKGGNDYLAARINEAKELLIGLLKK